MDNLSYSPTIFDGLLEVWSAFRQTRRFAFSGAGEVQPVSDRDRSDTCDEFPVWRRSELPFSWW
jgi:hypothetical protein